LVERGRQHASVPTTQQMIVMDHGGIAIGDASGGRRQHVAAFHIITSEEAPDEVANPISYRLDD